MATSSPATPRAEDLPSSYDALVTIDQLRHGEHNPRCVRPRDELVRSIKRDGMQKPLIVRPDERADWYHVTDGWQRYQVATELGWEALPVDIYKTPLEALEVTETESIVREWSPYEWAQFCASVAAEVETETHNERAQAVAKRVAKSQTSIERYLAALALPSEVHPLLSGGPEGSESDWQALANYNDNIRQYGNLPWAVAAKLGRVYRENGISADRAIGLAANAVAYDQEAASLLVERGCEEPDLPLSTVQKLIQNASTQGEYLRVPGVTVSLPEAEKRELMEYCAETRTPLSQLVATHLQQLAAELQDKETAGQQG